MAARLVRRTFATPFVVTLAALPAACVVQPASAPSAYPTPATASPGTTAPGPSRPGVVETQPATGQPTVVSNPPRPGVEPAPPAPPAPPKTAPAPTYERHWTVSNYNNTCSAFEPVDCPKPVAGKPVATCNPPPPRPYTCTPEITASTPLKIVQHVGQTACFVEQGPMQCPPNMMCNPPPPRRVDCPQ